MGSALSSGGVLVVESGGALSLAPGASASSAASGGAVTLAADGAFVNQAGAAAVSAAHGRWLIYSQANGSAGSAPTGDRFGGLAGTSWYGDAYSFAAGHFTGEAASGNRFVYGWQPTLTVTSATQSVTYDAKARTDSYSVTGSRAAIC